MKTRQIHTVDRFFTEYLYNILYKGVLGQTRISKS